MFNGRLFTRWNGLLPGDSRGMIWWVVLVAALFALPSLNDGLVSDDYELIAEGRITAIQDVWSALAEPGMKGFYRPIPRLLLGLNWAVHELHPFGYHVINAVIHVATVVVLVRLLIVITASVAVSMMAGLFFAGHFVHIEPVYWVSARNELLAALCYLTAVWWSFRPGRSYRAISFLAFLVALLSKETAVTLPLAVALITMMRAPGAFIGRLGAGVRSGIPYALILAGYGILRWQGGADWPWTSREIGFGIDPALILKNVEQYTIQLLVPVRTILDLRNPDTYGAMTGLVRAGHDDSGMLWWLILGAVLLIAGGRIIVRLGGPYAGAGLVFALITALPFLFMEGSGLRYLYLPSAGFALAAAAGLYGLAERWQIQKSLHRVVVAIVLMFLLVSVEQGRWWDRAGRECDRVIHRVTRYAAVMSPETPLYVFNIPRRLRGAYVFHNGFEAAIRLNDPALGRRIMDGERALERGEIAPQDAVVYRIDDWFIESLKMWKVPSEPFRLLRN